jgi:hypothetical protein
MDCGYDDFVWELASPFLEFSVVNVDQVRSFGNVQRVPKKLKLSFRFCMTRQKSLLERNDFGNNFKTRRFLANDVDFYMYLQPSDITAIAARLLPTFCNTLSLPSV